MPIPEYVKRMRAQIGSDLLLLVGAAAIVLNERDEVLLQLRSDNHTWGLPGGACEPGEEPAVAAVREGEEETGLLVAVERLVGIYGGPDMRFTYPNGDQVAITSITFACRVIGGALRLDDDESLDLRWFALNDLPEAISPWIRQRIVHALTLRSPYFATEPATLTHSAPINYIRHMRQRIGNELLVLIGTAAVIVNPNGEVLLQLRRDTGTWGLPGGFLEPGEEPAAAVIREVQEETGLIVEAARLVGVYAGPRMVYAYPNGDRVADTAIVFFCRIAGGMQAIADDESLDLRWWAADSLPLGPDSRIRRWIDDALTRETPCYYLPE